MIIRRPDVDFLLTNTCENKCKHCVFDSSEKLADELDTYHTIMALKSIKRNLKVKSISLTGGEPLLKKNFKNIYIEAYNLFSITLITTGINHIKNIDSFLSKFPPKQVICSLYGLRKEHNLFCQNSNGYDSVINFLKIFQNDKKVNKAVNIVCNNVNIETVPVLIDTLAESGLVNEIKLIPLSPVGRGRNITDLLIGSDKWINFIKSLKLKLLKDKIKLSKGIYYERHAISINSRLSNLIHICPLFLDKNGIFSSCVHIDANGSAYPCTMFLRNKDLKIFDVLEFEKINLDNYYKNKNDIIEKIYNRNCEECGNKKICKRGCIGFHYSLNRDYRCSNLQYIFGCPDRYEFLENSINKEAKCPINKAPCQNS